MNIINPNLATNTISVLPRKTYSEGNISEEYSVRVNSDEGERYTFKIYKIEEEIFSGIILVTEFDQDNYTINNNEFVIDTDTDSDSIPVYE